MVLWNCSGLLPSSSNSEKMDFITLNMAYDILIFIETHHKTYANIAELCHVFSTTHTIIHSEASVDDPFSGILVFFSKALTISSSSVLLSGRLLNFKVEHGTQNFNISVLYGYTGLEACVEKMELITDLLSNSHDIFDTNLILGDFNFVDNDLDRTNRNRAGTRLIST